MASEPFFIKSLVWITLALLVDFFIGDPPKWPHPVKIMGWGIQKLEARFNRPAFTSLKKKWLGGLTAVSVIAGASVLAWGGLYLVAKLSIQIAILLNIWLIASTIAWKGLVDAGKKVREALALEDIALARKQVGQIVGRDTQSLDETEIIRATVETLAENLVDGIIAPIFYAALGQAPLALAYRAVNTLDSMVGYKHERWRDFGFVSAKLDDIANWVPARITGALLLFMLFLVRKDARAAWEIFWRDAKKHPSPNGGVPEAIVAGGFGIRLGGWNTYHGVPSFRAYLGDPLRDLRREDIRQVIRLIHGVVALVVTLMLVMIWGWWQR